MEYTLEQKALAAIRGDLWWRLPYGEAEDEREWSLLHEDVVRPELNDLQKPGFVYHIGPKAPPILSELESELLAALEEADKDFAIAGFGPGSRYRVHLIATIAKAKGEA